MTVDSIAHRCRRLFRVLMTLAAVLLFQGMVFAYGQDDITLNLRSVPVGKVLSQIEQATGYHFVYSNKVLNDQRPVSIKVEKASLQQVMQQLLKGTGLTYRLDGKSLVIIKVVGDQDNRQKLIRGRITDTTGQPISGVSVQILHTKTGVITDMDGRFELQASSDDTLVFSYIGYQVRQIAVGDQNQIDVHLIPTGSSLNDIVVVGYGTQQKKFVTGSVASISGSDIKDIPVSSVTNALAGRLAGVVINSPSGLPGVGSGVQVHGVTSYAGQDILYVIDGIVRTKADFDLINPQDIESISVLKDAAAAIYGVRGGNGVLLITTKRGKEGNNQFTATASWTTLKPTRVPERLSSYQDAIYRNQYYTNQGVPAGDPRYYGDDEIAYYKSGKINTDLNKLMSRTPTSEQATINLIGGSDKIKYYVSGGIYNETGLFNKIQSKRYTLLSNLDFKLSRDLSMSLNLQGDYKPIERPWWYDGTNNYQADLFRASLNFTPLSPGYVNGKPDGTLYHFLPSEVVNNGGYIKNSSNTINAFVKFKYEPSYLKGFGAYVSYNYNKTFSLIKERYKPYPLYHFNLFGSNNHLVGDSVTSIVMAQQQDYDYFQEDYNQVWNYTLNAEMHYNRNFGRHYLGLQFLYEQYEQTGDQFGAQGQHLLSSTIDELFMADSDPNRRSISGSGSELGRESYLGRVNYRFNNRYLLEGIFRFDGSSVFAPKNKWGFFPSVSAGWILSEEPFIKKLLPAADNLKLRASYGKMGYDDPSYVPLSQWYAYYSVAGNAVFDNVANTIAPQLYPNPDITWQKIASFNIGLDASFFNGLLSGSIDWYNKKTTDLLVNNTAIIPGTFGINVAQQNYGQVNAHGIDLTLRHDNEIGDIKYYVGLNFSYNTNEVIKYPEAAAAADYQRRIGRPVNFVTGYQAVGIARTPDDLVGLPKYGTRDFELGDIIFKDIAGPDGSGPDGKIDANDNIVLSMNGADPRITYGIPLGLSYKGFDLNLLIQGVANRKIIFPDRSQWQEQNVESFWADAWTPDNTNGAYPKIGGLNGTQGPASSFWLRNGAYTRLKYLELGYSLPGSLLKSLHLIQGRIYVSGSNLFLLQDHIKVFDPELQVTQNGGYGGFQYPLMRSFTVGVNIKF